ncbi:hypothetical protein [Kribbella soli]|uniref:Ribbon-helix-helix protein, CopG family n=1 Tax=Kribbella soli TaxID=1124743 RepID=A0A4R0GW69_9ACTN|nr:hypothetical protein [Kribbella soli]TCC01333.1 hypothetical protein E0H45_42190 [Kribbella soli]
MTRNGTVVSVQLDHELLRQLDALGTELGAKTRSDVLTWCVVAAITNKQAVFGSIIRLHAESALRAMKNGETR